MVEIEVTISNWEKYQFRKTIHKPSWFRLQNDAWNDQQFYLFTGEERWVWVCLLSLASKKATKTFKVNLEWIAKEAGVTAKTIEIAIEKLKRNGCVTYTLHESNMLVPLGNPTIHNITEHNKQNITEQNITKEVCTELKQVSVAVPTEIIKKQGLGNFINQKLLELYPQEYIDREKIKMELWLATNSHKKPKSEKGMVRFVSSWLSRGWEQYRRGLQSNPAKEKGIAELLKEEEEQNGCITI